MTATQILENNRLSITQSRQDILELFLQSNVALSEDEIRRQLIRNCDRATIYRNLKIFFDSGILHRIVTDDMSSRYTIKKSPAEHLHFKCEECQKVICLTEINPGPYELPEGFEKKESNFLIIGICANCKKNIDV